MREHKSSADGDDVVDVGPRTNHFSSQKSDISTDSHDRNFWSSHSNNI